MVLSVRGLNEGAIDDSWERQHVIFTHGNGVAMAAAYDSGPVLGESRALDFLVRGLGEVDIADELSASLEQPRIYYGEDFGANVVLPKQLLLEAVDGVIKRDNVGLGTGGLY